VARIGRSDVVLALVGTEPDSETGRAVIAQHPGARLIGRIPIAQVPAYLAAGYAGYSVVNAKEHHWWDVATSAGVAWTYSRIFTSEWHHKRFYGSVYADTHGAYVNFDFRF